jgi:adenylyltransferase/sulfurtransferase
MPVRVRIPNALRAKTGGITTIQVAARTVDEAVASLVAEFPNLGAVLYGDDGALRPRVSLYVNDVHVRYREGLDTSLSEGDEVYVVPIVMGG